MVLKTKVSRDEDARAAGPCALDTLYRREWRALCHYVRRNFGQGPPDPEDVAQVAFEKLASLSDREPVANPSGFLRRAARNVVFDDYRHKVRTTVFNTNVRIFESGTSDFSPEDVISSRRELDRLGQVIAELKPKQRVAFMMHRVDGLSNTEIARRMGISESYARALVDAAHRRCAAALKQS
jgi:RNA polymerase sigma-70 factor (ECF subfamily)